MEEKKVKHIYNVVLFTNKLKKKSHLQLMEKQVRILDSFPDKYELNCGFIYDQGSVGSCVAHGCCSAYRIMYNYRFGKDFKPSRLFLYYRTRAEEHNLENEGCIIDDALKCLENKGVCNESMWPYIPEKKNVIPNKNCYKDALKHRGKSWGKLVPNPNMIISIKQVLLTNKPVILGMMVYSSFEGKEVEKTGIVPIPDTKNESILGGHCMLIVGYDDKKKLVKVLNSWGSDWGDNGYCYIPYEYIMNDKLCDEFLFINGLNDNGKVYSIEEDRMCSCC